MLVEQSTQRALDVADQVVVMESGRRSWQGSGLEARQNPSIVGAYLGTTEGPSLPCNSQKIARECSEKP